MLISPEYKQLNIKKHEGKGYGIHGYRFAEGVHNICMQEGFRSVLDYGCGKGTLSKALPLAAHNYQFSEYDPAIKGKDGEPNPAELVVCTDVLEHIEPVCIDDVLDHIKGLTLKAAFFVVHTGPAMKTLADGRNAHLIIEKAYWWLREIGYRFDIERFSGTRKEFSAIVRPKNG